MAHSHLLTKVARVKAEMIAPNRMMIVLGTKAMKVKMIMNKLKEIKKMTGRILVETIDIPLM